MRDGRSPTVVSREWRRPGVRLEKSSASDAQIYVDLARPAVLEHGSHAVNSITLREAIIAFENLLKNGQDIATITSAGRTFMSAEIRRLLKSPTAIGEEAAIPETPKGGSHDGSPVTLGPGRQ